MENKTTYIHETHTLYADNGELYIIYDDNDKQIVFNIDALYRDLPSIIRLCVEEKKKHDKFLANELQNTLKEL